MAPGLLRARGTIVQLRDIRKRVGRPGSQVADVGSGLGVLDISQGETNRMGIVLVYEK